MVTTKTIYLNIAGFNIQINLKKTEFEYFKEIKKEEIKKYWSSFLVNNKPKKIDFIINFVEKKNIETIYQIKSKKNFINFYQIKTNKIINSYYQCGPIQFQIILKQVLSELLNLRQGMTVHCSAVRFENKAYLFLGRPGAGKSTAMSLLSKKFLPLADDSGIIKQEGRNYFFYQTPFLEKNSWIKKNNDKLYLGKIFFLRKKPYFKIEKIENKDYIIERMIKQLFSAKELGKKQMKTLLRFISQFDGFYFLSFTKDQNKLIKLINCDK